MMRLPVLFGPTDFDCEHLNWMADAFLTAGYTCFDTGFVYHNRERGETAWKANVERYPRDGTDGLPRYQR